MKNTKLEKLPVLLSPILKKGMLFFQAGSEASPPKGFKVLIEKVKNSKREHSSL